MAPGAPRQVTPASTIFKSAIDRAPSGADLNHPCGPESGYGRTVGFSNRLCNAFRFIGPVKNKHERTTVEHFHLSCSKPDAPPGPVPPSGENGRYRLGMEGEQVVIPPGDRKPGVIGQ